MLSTYEVPIYLDFFNQSNFIIRLSYVRHNCNTKFDRVQSFGTLVLRINLGEVHLLTFYCHCTATLTFIGSI